MQLPILPLIMMKFCVHSKSLVQDHGDIILKAGMNSGSEVIASGNIHIYGTVRGRVIAGAGGHAAARIFANL